MIQHSPQIIKLMLKFQQAEVNDALIYTLIASRVKNETNRQIILRIASDEKDHAAVWKKYTNKTVKPAVLKVYWYYFLSYVMGFTFIIKFLETGEYNAIKNYAFFKDEIPEVPEIIRQEQEHENQLMALLDEERLQYVGAMVLGLNDALVELTGTIAGLTFALANTRIVALAGIITGIAATLSMAASNYLAEKADGNPNALKASFYTGAAYLVTVVLLVLPYLLFPHDMYAAALATMLIIVILIILFFNYYISVAKSLPFKKRFFEMVAISLSVAVIAFCIGLLAKKFLGIEV